MGKYKNENEFQNRLFVALVRHEIIHNDLFVYHVPNGGYRDKITAKIMQLIGLRKGVSDLHVLGGGKMLFVELKYGKGNQSNEQKVFEQKAKSNGFTYMLFDDSNEIDYIVNQILTFLYN